MSTTKIPATLKKYSKQIGKIYWWRDTVWSSDHQNYNVNYYMVMVVGLERRFNRGNYKFKIERLEKGCDTWRSEWSVTAAIFERFIIGGTYIPASGMPVRPEPYVTDDWRGQSKNLSINEKKVDGEQNML